jgi:hypothetical protein
VIINWYYISGYWWLLIGIILVDIGGYYIIDYWWLFYWWLLMAILFYILKQHVCLWRSFWGVGERRSWWSSGRPLPWLESPSICPDPETQIPSIRLSRSWNPDLDCSSVEVLKPKSRLSVCRGPETQIPNCKNKIKYFIAGIHRQNRVGSVCNKPLLPPPPTPGPIGRNPGVSGWVCL